MGRSGHWCTTAHHWLRSPKNPSSHHVTVTGQQFCMGSAVLKRYATKSIAVRTWSIRQYAQKANSTEMLKQRLQVVWMNYCTFMDVNAGVTGKGGAIRWRTTMYTNPQCRWNSQATFSGNQWYNCTHTKTMYDVCAYKSLPTSAILALGFLKKREKEKWWKILHGQR